LIIIINQQLISTTLTVSVVELLPVSHASRSSHAPS